MALSSNSTTKEFQQFFENFKGEDLRRSHLTRDPDAATSMLNLEYRESQSLVGRQGCKMSTQPLFVKQLFTYEYVDDDGVPQSEVICLGIDPQRGYLAGGSLYRLKTGTVTITRTTGSVSWDYSLLADSTIDQFTFSISQDGAVYYTSNVGNGFSTSDTTLWTLISVIDATTNFSCTVSKTAKVNGTQTGVTTVTVESGHTIAAGDIIPLYNRRTLASLMWLEVLSTTATTITFKAPAGSITSINVTDDDIIGLGRFYAMLVPLHVADEDSDDAKTATFEYWEKIPCPTDLYDLATSPFSTLGDNPGDRTYLPAAFCNARNVCYVTSAYAQSRNNLTTVGTKTTSGSISYTAEGLELVKYRTGVWKYDGKDVYMSGLPTPDFNYDTYTAATFNSDMAAVESGAGSLTSGPYHYRHSFLYVDAKGNEIEFFSQLELSLTTVAAHAITLTLANITTSIVGYYPNGHYNAKHAIANGTVAAPNTSFTVTSGHNLRTGDNIWFLDNSSKITRRTVTGWTNTTITLDIAATITTSAVIGTILHRVWRSPVNSPTTSFYLCKEYPNHSSSTTSTITDAVADADLGISIEAVEPADIQASLPAGNSIVAVQNVIVVGGGNIIPQEMHWENIESPEFTALARFNDRLISTAKGDITALATDKSSSIAVFKESAQYRLLGSLPSAQYEIDKVIDTGPGISGPQALAMVEGAVMGVNNRGLLLTADGNINKKFGKEYAPKFLHGDFDTGQKLVPAHAQVFHDYLKKRVLFFVPAYLDYSAASPAGESHSSYSQLFVYDYSQSEVGNVRTGAIWYRFIYPLAMYPSGGFTYYDDKLYFASWMYDSNASAWTGYTFKRLENETSCPCNDYLDNTETYDWELAMQWDDGGLPKIDKAWMEFVLYMLQPDLFVNPFDVTFQSYRDWSTSKVDSLRTLSFLTDEDVEVDVQFDKKYKARRRQIKLSGTIDKNPPVITGFEYSVDSEKYATSEKFKR